MPSVYKFVGVSLATTGGVHVLGQDGQRVGDLILCPVGNPDGSIVFAIKWTEEDGEARRVSTWKFYPDHGARARRIEMGDHTLNVLDEPPKKPGFFKRIFRRRSE